MIEIRTLGKLAVLANGGHVHLPTRKLYALLIYLACHPERVFYREQLTNLLWEGPSIKKARHSLSQALYTLRRAIHQKVIQTRGERIWIDKDCIRVDALVFQEAVAQKDFVDAISIYTGHFLEGFYIRGARSFNEWQERFKHQLQRLEESALRQELGNAKRRGDWLSVLNYSSRLLQRNAFDESAHADRLRAIALLEGLDKAKRELHQVREFFKAELGCEPALETQLGTLGRSVDRFTLTGSKYSPETIDDEDNLLPLIGREREFQALRDAWQEAIRGYGRVVLVRGRAGIGKSRLCGQLLRFAVLRDARVLRGRCYASERQLPYSGLVDALLSNIKKDDVDLLPEVWASALGDLLPELCPGDRIESVNSEGEAAQRRLFGSVIHLLKSIAARSPVVLFLDDFHWADDSTAAFVHYLARQSCSSRILILLAFRPEDIAHVEAASNVVAALSELQRCKWVDVEELDEAAIEKLLDLFEERTSRSIPADVRTQLLHEIGRVPFFLVEVLKALSDKRSEPSAILSPRHPNTPVVPLTESIERFIHAQFRKLGSEAKRIVEALAVLGSITPFHLIEQVTGLTKGDLVQSIDETVALGFVRDLNGAFIISHDLVREATYRLISSARRQVLHNVAADVLKTIPDTPPGVLAVHYHQAGNKCSAYEYAMQAANASKRLYASREAEYFLNLALANAGEGEGWHAKEELASLYFESRRYSEAESLLDDLLEKIDKDLDPHRWISLQITRATIHVARGIGVSVDIAEHLEKLADFARRIGATYVLPKIVTQIMVVAFDIGDRERVERAADEMIAIARNALDVRTAVTAAADAASAIGAYRSADEALRISEWVHGLANRDGSEELMHLALSSRGTSYYLTGRLDEAEDDFLESLTTARRLAQTRNTLKSRNNLSVVYLERGDYERSEEMIRELIQFAEESMAKRELLFAYGNLAVLCAEKSEWQEAERAATEALVLGKEVPNRWCDITAWAIIGLCALEYRRMDKVKCCREKVLAHFDGREFWAADASYAEIFLSRVYEREGEVDRALERLDRAIAAYAGRDVFCRSRLRLERARLLADRDPEVAWREAGEVRDFASRVGARPLVEKADRILDRLPALR